MPIVTVAQGGARPLPMSLIRHPCQACPISQRPAGASSRRCDRGRTAGLAPIFRRTSRHPAERTTRALQPPVPNWQVASQPPRVCPRALNGATARGPLRPHGAVAKGLLRSANSLIQKAATASDRTDRKNRGSFYFVGARGALPVSAGFPPAIRPREEGKRGSKTYPPRRSSAAMAKDRTGVVPSFEVILSTCRLCGGERPLSSLTKALPWSP
jgi:hypothetical protein